MDILDPQVSYLVAAEGLGTHYHLFLASECFLLMGLGRNSASLRFHRHFLLPTPSPPNLFYYLPPFPSWVHVFLLMDVNVCPSGSWEAGLKTRYGGAWVA